jgi:hypothetical protein
MVKNIYFLFVSYRFKFKEGRYVYHFSYSYEVSYHTKKEISYTNLISNLIVILKIDYYYYYLNIFLYINYLYNIV